MLARKDKISVAGNAQRLSVEIDQLAPVGLSLIHI